MRLKQFLVALCAAIITLPTVAQSHSGFRVIIPVIVNNKAGPSGPLASLPLDILDSPPEAMSGPLSSGAVIAQYRVRARDAVVLTAPVNSRLAAFPAGTVLARYSIKHGEAISSVWCGAAPTSTFRRWIGCFEDLDAHGTFTMLHMSFPAGPSSAQATGLIEVMPGIGIPATSYRTANAEERPVTKIGYRLCDGEGDGASVPYRFTSVILRELQGWWGAKSGCPFGEWPDATDKTLQTVDLLRLRISGSGHGLTYEVVTGLRPGPIADFASNTPVQPLGGPDVIQTRKTAARAAVALVASGPASDLATGVVRNGDVIARVPVVHGVTGVLMNDISRRGIFGGDKIAAGHYTFGIPMNGPGGEEITWCVPRTPQGGGFSLVCFPRSGASNVWVEPTPSLMPLRIWFSPNSPEVIGLSIDRKPASMGTPMTLLYKFNRWYGFQLGPNRLLAVDVGVEISAGGTNSSVGNITVLPSGDGVYRLPVQNGRITFGIRGNGPAPFSRTFTPQPKEEFDAFLGAIDPNSSSLTSVAPTQAGGLLLVTGVVSANAPAVAAGTR